MRVACVLVTHLRAKVKMNRHPHLKSAPVLVVDHEPSSARSLVMDHFPSACDVKEGTTSGRVMSRHAKPVSLNAYEPHYRQVFGEVLTAL